jgi:glycerate dehydrogenase
MRGVILDRGTFDCGDIDTEGLEAALHEWRSHDSTGPGRAADRLDGAQVVVSNKVAVDRAMMERTPTLELIVVAATGTNNVDLAAAAEYGITVCNVRDYATPAVAQHTIALMLALATRLADYRDDVRAGRWQRSPFFCLLDHPIVELRGKTLGIVGYGNLGRAVATAATGLGMEVTVTVRPGSTSGDGERVPLEQLLPAVDVLTLHCPLTDDTRGLIGAAELAAMKPSAFLVNTARGGIVDEQALADALRNGVIAGAGIDVLANEPPSDEQPLLAGDIPNLIVTPHNAWASRETRQRLADEIAALIGDFRAGRPRNVITA